MVSGIPSGGIIVLLTLNMGAAVISHINDIDLADTEANDMVDIIATGGVEVDTGAGIEGRLCIAILVIVVSIIWQAIIAK